MRVLLVHNNFVVNGGAEVFYHEVGRVLVEQGHEVAYFSAADDGADTPWRGYFPSVASYNKGGLLSKVFSFPKMVYNHVAKDAMARLLADFKPDIVHAFAIYVQLTPAILDAVREAGVPVVMSCNDYKHICPNYKLYHHGEVCEECRGGRFYRAMVNRCCHNSLAYSVASSLEAYAHGWVDIYRKNVHTFLFASEFMAQKTEDFWGKEHFRWRMLRNPFDAGKYPPPNPDEAGDYALYFGRIIDEKGVNVLLDAAALACDVPLMVVGDGPDLEGLRQKALERGLSHVQFLGAMWGNELERVLKACRYVVVPSLWHENFPYVILQSFAMGKPVIGSNRGGITELVADGEHGLVYDATNPAALADAMTKLWSDKLSTARMSQTVRLYAVNEFNDQRFYATLLQIYDGILT